MDTQAIYESLKASFSDAILACDAVRPDPVLRVAPAAIADVCRALKDGREFQFDLLECLSGVDHGSDLGVTYHLYSCALRHRLVVAVRVPRANPSVPTVDRVWAAANWHEREAFDLLGIVFEGSRDLRRILTAPGWEGHPLRKDYKPPESFQGIPLK
jgi:NADH-quinone oxidoreductase subunit C